MSKPFLTYAQQISLLKSKRLIIPDEEQAQRILSQAGYFSLIGGYKHLFKNKTTKNYRDDVSFSDIVALYNFDEALRHLFLRYLLIIERSMKTKIAYTFCEQYGDDQSQYLLSANYNPSPQMQKGIAKLITTLGNLAVEPTDYPYINHHQHVHKNVPLWVLINAITFGNMSKMFGFLPQRLQSQIARNYPLNIPQLERILTVLTKYRNACAHGERLFSYTTRDDIPDLSLHRKLSLPRNRGQYAYGKRDLFAVVIALRYLLPTKEFRLFKTDLGRQIRHFTSSCNTLSENDLLNEMGFPTNWVRVSRFKR